MNLLGRLGLLNSPQAETYQSPEQIAQARQFAEALVSPLGEDGNLRRTEHFTQGIAHMINALIGRNVLNQANSSANQHALNVPSGAPPAPTPGRQPFVQPGGGGPMLPPPPAPAPNPLITGAIPPTGPQPNMGTFGGPNGMGLNLDTDNQDIMSLFGPLNTPPTNPNPAPGQGAGANAVQPTANAAGDRNAPRPIRTNNPGGMNAGSFANANGAIGTDGRLAVFPDLATGFAAQEALLNSYMGRGFNTVNSIVGRWAPRNVDNNSTDAYIAHVSRALGVRPDQPLDPAQIPRLADAMAHYESGRPVPRPNSAVVTGGSAANGLSTESRMNLGGPMPEGVTDVDSGEVILANDRGNGQGSAPPRVHQPTGMPYYDPNNLGTNFRPQLPPGPPPNLGFTPEQWAYISRLPNDQRQAQIEMQTRNYTPTFTEIAGAGRYWTIPATGQSGFIPTPRYGQQQTALGPVDTVTIFGMDGRRQTFILDATGEQRDNRAPAAPGIDTSTIMDRANNPPAPVAPAAPNQPTPAPGQPAPAPTTELRGTTGADDIGGAGTPPAAPIVPNFVPPAGQEVLNSGLFDNPVYQQSVQERRRIAADDAASTAGVAGTMSEIEGYAGQLPEGQQTLGIVNMLEGLLDTPQGRDRMTGQYAEQWLNFTRSINGVLRAGGRPPMFDESIVSASEAIQKLNTYLGSAAARGLTNRPTQFDFQAFLAANPGLATSDAGSRLMIQVLRGMAQRQVDLAQTASRVRTGSVGTGNISRWENERNQAYDRHTSNMARMIIDAARNDPHNRMNIPRGFRYNGREYTGEGNWRDHRNWRTLR